MAILDKELHVHLFGCLTAEDVWQLGKDHWHKQEQGFLRFEQQFENVYQRKPHWRDYWTKDNGFELLKSDYEFTHHGRFSEFQARFNLLIALFPLQNSQSFIGEVLEVVVKRQVEQGIKYAEYRLSLPVQGTETDINSFLEILCEKLIQLNHHFYPIFAARVIISLPRDSDLLVQQYTLLKEWLIAHQHYVYLIKGIDFCHIDEGYPPKDKQLFFQQFKTDNAELFRKHKLNILYHVGENFENLSLPSACRWIYQAAEFGADRLGHAIALGLDPRSLLGKTVREPLSEYYDHVAWLKEFSPLLSEYGFPINEYRHLYDVQRRTNDDHIVVHYDQPFIEYGLALQNALLKIFADRQFVIESCPTSNLRIGQIQNAHHHPLKRFVDHNLAVCISSDDPGIFDITLKHEEQFCIHPLDISKQRLEQVQRFTVTLTTA